MCSTSTPGYAPTMSLTTRFPLLQRAGWSRAGSSAGGAGGTNQLYVFILRGGGIILENLAPPYAPPLLESSGHWRASSAR